MIGWFEFIKGLEIKEKRKRFAEAKGTAAKRELSDRVRVRSRSTMPWDFCAEEGVPGQSLE